MSDNRLIFIGRKEIANLEAFGLYGVQVKIDSGAYTSSIDVYNINREKEILKVQFTPNGEVYSFTKFNVKRIKSSNGIIDERYIIEGAIELGGKIYTTPFSLSDRSGMRSPILLGRKLLNRNFVINTSKTNLLK